ncbi:MAG: AsmA family protein [Pseudodesulfovibrio sp.]|uniref:AsmA family protein n=1 Tax=Pseudodesulfovibrio sp. TaxID=2035812 RepID=UPI003D143D25
MNKTLKIGLMVIGGLAALFIAACILLVLIVDPNEYKAEISKAVKEQTGRELKFEGDISFNFFPWLGLEVGPMALGNAPGFAPDEMVRINRAEASIRLLPLLSGDVAVGVVVLDGLTLNLAKNKQGVTNWDDLTKSDGSGDKAAEEKPAAESEAKGGQPESLSVEGVEIVNANIVYDDMQAGKKTSVTDLSLVVGAVGDKVRFPFELKFRLKLDDPKIDTNPVLAGLASFDQAAGTIQVDELKFSLLNLELTGLLFAKSKDGALSYSAELKLAKASVRQLMKELGMEAPATADPKVLEALSADLKVNGSDTAVSLENLTVKLDDTTLTAEGSVKNFDKPALSLTANVDAIDADRYLPPKSAKSENEAGQETAPAAKEEPAQEPDLAALRDLDLKAKLTVGKLKVMNLTITEILAQLTARNGVLTAKPLSLKLYDGGFNGQGVLNVTGPVAAWAKSGALTDVQAQGLITDLMGKDMLHGTTNAKYDLKGTGLTPDNIKKSISGTASFAFTDGAVMGVNVAKMLRDGWNKLKGKPAGKDEPAKTDFAELLGSATLTNGYIENKDLLMKSPLLRVTGKGWADLPRNTTDYTAVVTVVGTLEGQDGASLEDLKGLPLPIYVKGDLNDPSIGLDMKAMGEALFKGTFKQGTKGLEQQLKQNILGTPKTGTSGTTSGDAPKTNPLKGLFKKQ